MAAAEALRRWEEDVAAMRRGTCLYLSNDLAAAEELFSRGMAGHEQASRKDEAVAVEGSEESSADDDILKRDTRGAYALQYAIVGLMRGAGSLANDQLEECLNRLWEADRLAALDTAWVGRNVVRGTCTLAAGLVLCMQREVVRGVWNIVRSWQWLRHLRRDALEYDGVGREIVRSAALMSLGAFALILSLLPQHLVRAASWSTGFEIDRASGLSMLRVCQQEGGIYAPIAALAWLVFHIDTKTFLGEAQAPEELLECKELLAWGSTVCDSSLFFGILEADLHACNRHLEAALEVIKHLSTLPALLELKAIGAVLQYKKALYHLAALEFDAAAASFALSQKIYKAAGRRSLGPAMACHAAQCAPPRIRSRQGSEPWPPDRLPVPAWCGASLQCASCDTPTVTVATRWWAIRRRPRR